MIDYNKIKLIIWDLDDTFWTGTLSEEGVEPIAANIELLKATTDCGVINSICSKNNLQDVERQLEKLELSRYFVFPSVDWTPKGPRISQLLIDMSLRAVNALFIDDNPINIQEALFYAPELMTATPGDLLHLCQYYAVHPKTDLEHKRLKQYHILEQKKSAKQKCSDNEAFLYSTDTRVNIKYNCLEQIERIHELLMRSNQLNYTKLRPSIEEITVTLTDPTIMCGYAEVSDKFGDYGIVGFFAIKDGQCIHFAFSCRAIGQGVEQYVYALLGYPKLTVVEPVVSYVNKSPMPAWINMEYSKGQNEDKEVFKQGSSARLLFKGPCDMALISSFLERSNYIETEFTYVGEKGNSIEQQNHSTHILQTLSMSQYQKKEILHDCVFADKNMFTTRMFDNDIDMVFLSTLPELNLGIYTNKSNGAKVVFGEWSVPITEPYNWNDLVNQKKFTAGNVFTFEWLAQFTQNYQFEGRLTPEQSANNIKSIFEYLPTKTTLVLILGVETLCLKSTQQAYENRHAEHKLLNNILRDWARSNKRVRLLDLNDFVHSQDDFTNNINHFTKRVYYDVSQEAVNIIRQTTGMYVKNRSCFSLAVDAIVASVRSMFNPRSNMYKNLRKIYHKIR